MKDLRVLDHQRPLGLRKILVTPQARSPDEKDRNLRTLFETPEVQQLVRFG
jgi:hypothetical protein